MLNGPKIFSVMLIYFFCLCPISRVYADDVIVISADKIQENMINLMGRALEIESPELLETRKEIKQLIKSAIKDFRYVDRHYPEKMMQEFVLYYHDLEVASDGSNRLLKYYNGDRIKKLTQIELSALFLLIKNGFPVESIKAKIQEN